MSNSYKLNEMSLKSAVSTSNNIKNILNLQSNVLKTVLTNLNSISDLVVKVTDATSDPQSNSINYILNFNIRQEYRHNIYTILENIDEDLKGATYKHVKIFCDASELSDDFVTNAKMLKLNNTIYSEDSAYSIPLFKISTKNIGKQTTPLTGTITGDVAGLMTGVLSEFLTQLKVGDTINVGIAPLVTCYQIVSITSDTEATITNYGAAPAVFTSLTTVTVYNSLDVLKNYWYNSADTFANDNKALRFASNESFMDRLIRANYDVRLLIDKIEARLDIVNSRTDYVKFLMTADR